MDTPALDETHHPALRSWVPSAQAPDTDFPIQNLPHGVFRRRRPAGACEPWRGGVAIGEHILDLQAALVRGAFADVAPAAQAAAAGSLNGLMALGPAAWGPLRRALSAALALGSADQVRLADCLVPQAEAEMTLPATVGNYTDFFTSRDHMRHMGALFQPDRPELPPFAWLPIAYHGRASTVEVSPSRLPRPWGQARPPGEPAPRFAPTRALDHEVELGCWVGPGNPRGEPIGIDDAPAHLFGISLLNDWSARDLQGWESVPLGPCQAKNFLTTLSPWIVTLAALAPFRCPPRRDADDPPLLPYLRPAAGLETLGLDIQLQATLTAQGHAPVPISRCSSRVLHWGFAQMLAHHSANGCALRPGDLLGSGTVSGAGPAEQGCLMELTQGGRTPLLLAPGEQRSQLHDGDTLVIRGRASRAGVVSIGFGECRGEVLPALQAPFRRQAAPA